MAWDNPGVSEELSRRYRSRSIFGPFLPVPPGGVRALEEDIGHPLPPDYRAYLEVANGGALQYAVRVPPRPDGTAMVFERFHSLQGLRAARRTLPGTVFTEAFAAERIPVDALLPIAADAGGSSLFLDLTPNGYGRVLGYVFGLPAWTGSDRGSMVGVLADDFHGYLDALFVDEETAEWAWEYYLGYEPTAPWRPVIEEWLDEGLPGWRALPWAQS